MSVSADLYIVISLMFAVFAAVAAVGTSIILGVGYERLRAGFDVIRKQSGFFSDAIYKLDQRTQKLGFEQAEMKAALAGLSDTVTRVDKQTAFFADAINGLEIKLDEATKILPVHQMAEKAKKVARANTEIFMELDMDGIQYDETVEPDMKMMDEMGFVFANENYKLKTKQPITEARMEMAVPSRNNPGLSKLLSSYFRGGDTHSQHATVH